MANVHCELKVPLKDTYLHFIDEDISAIMRALHTIEGHTMSEQTKIFMGTNIEIIKNQVNDWCASVNMILINRNLRTVALPNDDIYIIITLSYMEDDHPSPPPQIERVMIFQGAVGSMTKKINSWLSAQEEHTTVSQRNFDNIALSNGLVRMTAGIWYHDISSSVDSIEHDAFNK